MEKRPGLALWNLLHADAQVHHSNKTKGGLAAWKRPPCMPASHVPLT